MGQTVTTPLSLTLQHWKDVRTVASNLIDREETDGAQPDLTDLPLRDADFTWFTDGSSFLENGERKAGAAVTTESEVIWAEGLPPGTSAQKAKLIAMTKALQMAEGPFTGSSDSPEGSLETPGGGISGAAGQAYHPASLPNWRLGVGATTPNQHSPADNSHRSQSRRDHCLGPRLPCESGSSGSGQFHRPDPRMEIAAHPKSLKDKTFSVVIFSCLLPLLMASNSPYTPRNMTWQIRSQMGEIVWLTTGTHTPGTWWPSLTPDFCQLVAGINEGGWWFVCCFKRGMLFLRRPDRNCTGNYE
ncbi:uncharacterized protein RHO17_005265 [Thomomys bottae]